MTFRIFNVLFLCSGNSTRSIMAEAILNHIGRNRFQAFSAGHRPSGTVNPMALELLERQGLPTQNLCSKSWDDFAHEGAPHLDFVFTVCDEAHEVLCPRWPGTPIMAHWAVDDPVQVADVERQREAIAAAFHLLNRRISMFTNLPLEKLDSLSMRLALHDIGAPEHEADWPAIDDAEV